jgi:hypothetical protein
MLAPLAFAEVPPPPSAGEVRLANGVVSTTFNPATGEWSAAYADGTVWADQLQCVLDAGGKAATGKGGGRGTVGRFKDKFGEGSRAEIAFGGERPFVLALSLHDGAPFFLAQVRLPNARGLRVREVLLPEGRLFVGADRGQVATISNYWNGEWYTEMHPMEITDRRPRWDTYSHFYMVLYNRGDGRSVLLGAAAGQGAVKIEAEADAKTGPRAIAFRARCGYDKNPLTVEADAWESPPMVLAAPGSVFHGLEAYGALVKALRPLPVRVPPPSGWCSWDAGASGSQKEFFANVDAMKEARLDEWGLRIVQLDDGWQKGGRNTTTWVPDLGRFPAGMKGVADYVRAKGFEPGLWAAPLSEQDLGDPKFPDWLRGEVKRFVSEWGFHYVKADFLSYPHKFTSKTVPYDVAYLNAIRILEDGVRQAPDGYLMTCINHEWLSVGWADGQRMGTDVHGGDLTGLYPTLKTWPRRYFTNNTFWVGDPDMMHVNLPTDEQARAWASFVALAGGATLSGDNIPKLLKGAPSRLEIMKKAYPAQGFTARPCDLFERPTGWAPRFPRIWDCRVSRPGVGAWRVVGLFNWTVDLKRERENFVGEPANVAVDFGRHLELPAGKRYLVYDFWAGKYLGAFEKALSAGLAPASCRVLVVREELARPQVLATDRHIVSGAEDLKAVRWDAATNTLAGTTETVKRIPYALAIHVPAGFAIQKAAADGKEVAVEKLGEFAARIALDTGDSGKVEWSVAFRKADTRREPTADPVVSRVEVPRPDPAAREIALRNLSPLWTDRRHDMESGLMAGGDPSPIGTVAPWWVAWDVAAYTKTHTRLVAEVANTSPVPEGGERSVFFEVLGDGKRLFATDVIRKGGKAPLDVPVEGVKELTLICHYVDGWFSSTRAQASGARLVSP